MTFSSTGSRSSIEETLLLAMRMYGSSKTVWRESWSLMKFGEMKPLSNCMPSVTSSTVSRPEPSSIEMTPSTPTVSMAFAMSSPISGSCAEIAATCAMFSWSEIWTAWFSSSSETACAAASMPLRMATGLAPAVTALMPARLIFWARTVAVVVPSPATSLVLVATSLTNCAPRLAYGSESSISLAMVTPSLVMIGAPKERSRTTLRPFGPSVTLTVSASSSMPRSSSPRASSAKFRIFGMGFPSSVERRARRGPYMTARGPGRRYCSTTARTSRDDRTRYSSPAYLTSVPPYLE